VTSLCRAQSQNSVGCGYQAMIPIHADHALSRLQHASSCCACWGEASCSEELSGRDIPLPKATWAPNKHLSYTREFPPTHCYIIHVHLLFPLIALSSLLPRLVTTPYHMRNVWRRMRNRLSQPVVSTCTTLDPTSRPFVCAARGIARHRLLQECKSRPLSDCAFVHHPDLPTLLSARRLCRVKSQP